MEPITTQLMCPGSFPAAKKCDENEPAFRTLTLQVNTDLVSWDRVEEGLRNKRIVEIFNKLINKD